MLWSGRLLSALVISSVPVCPAKRSSYDLCMSFLGLGPLAWTAIAAIAGILLAAATVAAIIVTVRIARTDRKRDGEKREQDRKWDSDRRKEDRDRDDRLRHEAADEWERRTRAERADREDYEARQVTVELHPGEPPSQPLGHRWDHRITVSAPATYPVKQVEVQIAYWSNANLGIMPLGHTGDKPESVNGRVYYRFWAEISDQLYTPTTIARFVDRHGNLYYNYLHQTMRFPQNTGWEIAAQQIWKWVATGPKAEEP
jgi:hypothetical protein